SRTDNTQHSPPIARSVTIYLDPELVNRNPDDRYTAAPQHPDVAFGARRVVVPSGRGRSVCRARATVAASSRRTARPSSLSRRRPSVGGGLLHQPLTPIVPVIPRWVVW